MIRLIKNQKVISMIGMGKNVGKTTVLNYIIKHFWNQLTLGLTSIGYDGEEIDNITRTQKPRIAIPKHTIFATSTIGLEQSRIKYEVLKKTNMMTPLGEIYIVRALTDGQILLTGPSTKSQIKQILKIFQDYKVDLSLIDGAFGKMMQSDSYLADASILSTGTAFHLDIDKLVSETIYRVSLYSEDYLYRGLNFADQLTITVKSALGNEAEVAKLLTSEKRVLNLEGALTDKLMMEILRQDLENREFLIVLKNPTMCFLSKEIYQLGITKNIHIKFLETTKILAITVNPVAPTGESIASEELIAAFRKITNIPVYDVCKEIKEN